MGGARKVTMTSQVDPRGNQAHRAEMDRGRRTCIGCGRSDEPEAMLRLIVAPTGEVAIDLAGGKFGRGAHVHATPRCLAGTPRGLTKSFRRPIEVTTNALASAIVADVSVLHSYDRNHILNKNGLIGDPPLKIEEPNWKDGQIPLIP